MALSPKWEKMAQKWRRNRKFLFLRHFWAIFSPFRAEGHFLFFCQFFPIFGFRPVFHSIPGGLTRNSVAPPESLDIPKNSLGARDLQRFPCVRYEPLISKISLTGFRMTGLRLLCPLSRKLLWIFLRICLGILH